MNDARYVLREDDDRPAIWWACFSSSVHVVVCRLVGHGPARDSGHLGRPWIRRAYATTISRCTTSTAGASADRFSPKSKRSKGLKDDDVWQKGCLKVGSEALREIDF